MSENKGKLSEDELVEYIRNTVANCISLAAYAGNQVAGLTAVAQALGIFLADANDSLDQSALDEFWRCMRKDSEGARDDVLAAREREKRIHKMVTALGGFLIKLKEDDKDDHEEHPTH